MSNQNQKDTYFNVIMNGVAYINTLKVKKAKTQGDKDEVRVTLAMLYGISKKPKKEYYSCTVDTEKARDVLRPVVKDINDENKSVLATVIVSKGDSSPFMFEEGKKAGQMGVTHFGSLIEIKRLKVDGEVVYSQTESDEGYSESASFN